MLPAAVRELPAFLSVIRPSYEKTHGQAEPWVVAERDVVERAEHLQQSFTEDADSVNSARGARRSLVSQAVAGLLFGLGEK